MKQPDTAALRERLANYTPDRQFEQDKEELDELTEKIYGQIMALRNLLREINTLKEELHGIHGSLKHTQQRERKAFDVLLAVKDSADNIVDGICNAIVKAEQNTIIPASRHGRTGKGEPVYGQSHQGGRRTVGKAQKQVVQTPPQ